jgi:ElaB/YqjD/DUF883 family membrane-anchored ribosome-binding protein
LSKDKEDERDVERLIRSFRKDVDKGLVEVRGQLRALQKEATRTVKDKPLLALGVAFVAGMAIGMILSKSSD